MPRDYADDQTLELDVETEIRRLAELPPLNYEVARERAAERLGLRKSILDTAVENVRRHQDSDADAAPAITVEAEPWTEPVDGDALLDNIVSAVRRYLVLPDGAAEVVALWVLHAHSFEAFYHTPRLWITAPEKRCGKTVLLDVLECLTPRPIRTESLTTAVLFRVVDAERPTLLVDEFDSFGKDNRELRGALNAGHRRGGQHLRCEGENNEVRAFKTFAPVSIAGIGGVHGTLADRSIPIRMRRALPDEPITPFRGDRAHELLDLRRQAARWAADNFTKLESHDPDMPASLFNRQADNWRALLGVADIAGGEWPERARAVAARIGAGAEDQASVKVQLLTDIGGLFARHGKDQLASQVIAQELGEMEERAWSDWKDGKPISPPQIARMLKAFDIRPGTIRDGTATAKGYRLGQFDDALRRYGGSRNVTPSQVNESAASSPNRNVTTESSVTDRKPPNPAENKDCDVVTDRKGGTPEEGPIESGNGEVAAWETDL